MEKVTKKDLNERLLMVETLLGLHRERPEQISIDKANDAIFRMQWAVSRGKELAERESKPKQLDQSVFDGLDAKWRFAAINKAGRLMLSKSTMASDENYWHSYFAGDLYGKDTGYDASNWQDSLIERDIAKELLEVDLSSELTGSDLCRAMLERGDVCVPCFTSWDGDTEAIADKSIWLVHDFLPEEPNFHAGLEDFYFAVPINTRTGEPLTATDVGL